MKLSVIIPLYNKEKHISRCLDSLLAQDLTSTEYEIIIINDGSKDTSGIIAETYADRFTNIYLITQSNIGVSATRNKGIELATGKYIYFLDADDYVASNTFKTLLELCIENDLEILGFITKNVENESFTSSSTLNKKHLGIVPTDGMTFISEEGYRNEVWWYLINRKFLLDTKIKFVEGRLMEDSVFTSNLFLRASKMAKVKFDIHRFVKVSNSIQTATDSAHLLKFISDLVFAIEELDLSIKSLDTNHPFYKGVVNEFKRKQQSYVFTLFVKVYRCPPLKIKDIRGILNKLGSLGVYPIKRKIGGIGNKKTSSIYNLTYVTILNNKVLLFLSLKLVRLLS